MIIAQTADGQVFNIDSWATFHPTTPIKQLILTDGKQLVKSISGCEKYYAEREAISTIEFQSITKESIVGINDLTKQKDELLSQYNEAIKKILEQNPGDLSQPKLQKLKATYNEMLERLKKYEVIKFSLEFTQELYDLQSFDRDPIYFKDGGVINNIQLKSVLGPRYISEFVG